MSLRTTRPPGTSSLLGHTYPAEGQNIQELWSVTALHLHLFRSTCARGASHMAGCRAPDSKPGEEPQD